ncbi:metalloprotease TldD [Thorsellia anophelis]|uniref:TldD protein n=1 Tax=Thorsellia anophelis DSM 18579 TaxID=1123402 RepID=A0A1I0BXR5_9GAMM|nr:metalloprotease TldD [Thorsellia anophelis]SET11959.1 microcin-processing peptidase 2. Unknown type peptidase. MEROPS family U62 [Thorsellia anophelis DSM 18579]
MDTALVIDELLYANDLTPESLNQYLSLLSERNIDYGDLFFQSSYHEAWVLENQIIKEASYHIDQGVGVRAIVGEKTGFAYTDLISDGKICQSILAARTISQVQSSPKNKILKHQNSPYRYAHINPLTGITQEDKVSLLHLIDKTARNADSRVKEVTASITGVYELVLVAATDGTFSSDIRPLVRLSVSVLMEENGIRERGSSGGGARKGFDYFLQYPMSNHVVFTFGLLQGSAQKRTKMTFAEHYAYEAVRIAATNLKAKAAPAGKLPVVLGAGWPGVLLHEAVGHGLEGDFNRKGTSVFAGKLGTQVCSKLCTIVDDGTLPDRRGSLAIDDEGTPTQYNVLIEDGILKRYMKDKHNARLMKTKPTGNGRRESYAHLPMPRMTNTYMLPGESTPESIIESVDKGIYAPNFAGGQVDITSGKFVFTASEAYMIENGKITYPIKGATLIGSGIEVMQDISMVGRDLALDPGVGVCGKDGQSVPVGVGQPTIKVNSITIGGTQST